MVWKGQKSSYQLLSVTSTRQLVKKTFCIISIICNDIEDYSVFRLVVAILMAIKSFIPKSNLKKIRLT